jgi:hypothetical protein
VDKSIRCQNFPSCLLYVLPGDDVIDNEQRPLGDLVDGIRDRIVV